MPLDPWSYAAKTKSEHAEQVALFMWANMACRFGAHLANVNSSYNIAGWAKAEAESAPHLVTPIPQLKWLHAIHNQGHGDAIRGAKAKAEGVKEGVADIFLPVPINTISYHNEPIEPIFAGLYIELKRKDGGKPSDKQLEFQSDMRDAGYKCEIIHGWELARDEILRYLGYS